VECNPVFMSNTRRGSGFCVGPSGLVKKHGETAAFEDGSLM
jgi:hypothetical protein